MPRVPKFKCSICEEPNFKKNLYTRSLVISDTDKESGVKYTRRFCSGLICGKRACGDKWRESIYKKINEEKGI